MVLVLNRTDAQVASFMTFDVSGRQLFVILIKRSFCSKALGSPRAHDEPLPIFNSDIYWNDAVRSSVRYEADIAFKKPMVDLLLNAVARAPSKRPVRQLTVQCVCKGWRKSLLVTGDRRWQLGFRGVRASDPDAFETMPIVYDRAFGGICRRHEAPSESYDSYGKNPIGIGFQEYFRNLDGTRLPNVEYSANPIRTWTDRPEPAGLGVYPRNALPRRAFSGTYDEEWKRNRFPYLPLNFDERYFQAAPSDQEMPRYEPGTRILVTNVSDTSPLEIALPPFDLPLCSRWDDKVFRTSITPDTILIEPDADRIVLTARTALQIGEGRNKLREVIIGNLTAGEQRAIDKSKRYWSKGRASATISGF